MQSRIDSLEIQNDTENQNIDTLEAQISVVENSITQQEAFTEQLSTMESSLDEYGPEFLALEDRILNLEEKLSEIQEDILSLNLSDEEQDLVIDSLTDDDNQDEDFNSIQLELDLLKVMELITRVRVFLGQGNIGLAKSELP